MIDQLMALDPGGRGIAAFFVRGGATAAVALPPLQASLKVLGEPASVLTFHVPHAAGGGPEPGAAREAARRLLAEHRPTHLIAIERPGRARDGEYRSASGQSLPEWNGPPDELF